MKQFLKRAQLPTEGFLAIREGKSQSKRHGNFTAQQRSSLSSQVLSRKEGQHRNDDGDARKFPFCNCSRFSDSYSSLRIRCEKKKK